MKVPHVAYSAANHILNHLYDDLSPLERLLLARVIIAYEDQSDSIAELEIIHVSNLYNILYGESHD